MKKIWRVLILGELILCLVLAGMHGLKNSAQWQQAAVLSELEETEVQQEQEVRRIAITFDDEDIIGSSQRDAVKKRFL